MRWKTKAFIQNLLSVLPSEISYEVYYKVQRFYGGLRHVNPMIAIEDGIRIVSSIEGVNKSLEDKVFVEVGTGRTITVPIVLWLCGASRIFTVDINPYLKAELIQEEVEFIRSNKAVVLELFGNRGNQGKFNERFDMIVRGKFEIGRFMKESSIEYLAPSDARELPIGDKTIGRRAAGSPRSTVEPPYNGSEPA